VIFTFYSFKGGVGRSMAMANVAWELASRGLRVLVIDFDLEAPGLERYFGVPVGAVHATPGVINLIEAFKRSLSSSGGMGREAEFRRLANFIHRGMADFGRGGRLDLMPAGKRASDDDRRAYALAVRTFDWQDFYFNWEGQAFFEWLRRTLVEGPEAPYDVVLADSRTGVTEMGGVCACQLADVVVMLSAPNHQNMEGTRELADDLRSEPVQRLRSGRPPLQIVVVPARVEQRVPELLAGFEERFDKAFADFQPAAHQALGLQARQLALPYVPEFAFEEQVTHERSANAGALSEQYRKLADAILVLCEAQATKALADAVAAARARLAPRVEGRAGAIADFAVPPTAPAFDPTKRFAGVDAYLSCPRAARGVVQELLAALEQRGARLRTEFGTAEAYGTERDLPLTAEEQLRHAGALVLCADEKGVRAWQRAEARVARSLPAPPALVQLLLPGAPDGAFALAFGAALADCPLIDLRRWPHDTATLDLLARALAPHGPAEPHAGSSEPRSQSPPPADATPFPGTAAYGEQHAGFFGGRAAEVDALRALAVTQRRAVLHGAAGAGKTSLVLAGLFPRLRGSSEVRPLRHLDLRHAGRHWQQQFEAMQALPAAGLVVIDHADEAPDEVLAAFATWWQRSDGPRLLLVWRAAPLADFEAQAMQRWQMLPAHQRDVELPREDALHGRCMPGPAAAALIEAVRPAPALALARLAAEPLRGAVEQALAAAGRRAEAGLIERLFTDAGPAPAAATVQRVLLHLWQQQARGWLTNEAYDRAGGVDGLFIAELERHLGATPAPDRPALEALLPRLLFRGVDGALATSSFSWARSVAQPAMAGRAAALAAPLACAGVLALTVQDDDVIVELAHRPRDWAGLDPLLAAAGGWRPSVLAIAAAYAQWLAGGDADAADEETGAATQPLVHEHLSAGEAAFAAWRRRVLLRAQRQRVALNAAVGVVVLGFMAAAFMQSRFKAAADEEARAAAEKARASAEAASAAFAVAQARSQQEQSAALAGPGSEVRPAPPGTPATVVAHRTGSDAADARMAFNLLKGLSEARFKVQPRIEQREARVCGDVRFHHDEDAPAARELLGALNAELKRRGDLRTLQLNDRRAAEAAQRVARGTLEVWLPPLTDAPKQRDDRWGASRLVSAGCALVGSDAQGRETLRRGLGAADAAHFASELPVAREWIDAFYIGRTEVTAAAFSTYQAECERTRGAACPPWKPRFLDAKAEPDRPATFVTWQQAVDYCRWAGGRLPTDLEWEKAARGTDGRFWPWGFEPDDLRFQGKAQTLRRPVNVGSFPTGDSPYGVADMAGNVYEYTADRWDDSGHAIRGGSYLNSLMESRASVRWSSGLEGKGGAEYLGFRCVADVKR
jgi:hypothetical protein